MTTTIKPKLLYKQSDFPSLRLPWMRALVATQLDLIEFDPEQINSYRSAEYSVLVTYASMTRDHWYKPLLERGLRLVVDHLWDSDVAITPRMENGHLVVYCPNALWYLTALEFKQYGYDNYRREGINDRSFLMLMNNPRWHRDHAVAALASVLPTALYSYHAQGIELQDDKPMAISNIAWQRYMNPDWYNRTAFNVVSESYMRTLSWSKHPFIFRTEVSEKLFKPVAFYQPFIVYGSADTLKYLKAQGFETYSNWFDEGYDTIEDDDLRFAAVTRLILQSVDRWQRGEFVYDAETQRKAQHNHNHFFDFDLIDRNFDKEVLQPIVEYLS
jgi:hypothetical protein